MSRVTVEQVAYAGWRNCYRLTNGAIELIAVADIGPRVIRCGFIGGQNLFYECKDQLGNHGEPWWMIRGGHRFWIAPETVPETYALDNDPVEASVQGHDSLVLVQPVEHETGLRKEIIITMHEDGCIQLAHRITNAGKVAVRWAPWPATLLAPGGVAFASFPERATHEQNLLPTNPFVMWAYTDLSDKRWTFTKKWVVLRQDSSIDGAQKMGLFNERTFAAYLLNGELFVKRCRAHRNLPYADYNSSLEIFTNPDFMELETLGPLTELAPGKSVSHAEEWWLHRPVEIGSDTDPELDRVFAPFMQ
ncbi:MAG: hypothetical protein JO061_09680 [Acidobacteriaceae bacterium]|nr:hypothetical protein [Acidobacteriaceae bacterium]